MTAEYANFKTDAFFSSLCGKHLGKESNQSRYKCPKSTDKTRDIYVSATGAWKCHHAKCASQKGCHITGGGPRQFLSLINPYLKDKDAFELLNKYGRNDTSPSKQKNQEKPSKIWKAIDDIKTWLLADPPKGKGYQNVIIHEYPQTDGSPCLAVFRCEPGKEKSKDFYQYHKESAGWIAGVIKEKRPLYRLAVVANESGLPVIVCEGEKKADTLHKVLPGLSYWVTSPSQGAQSPNKTNWSPVKGRPVFILPDNDEPGLAFAQKVSTLCLEADAASVAIVEPFYGKIPNDSRDIGDFLHECGSVNIIIEAIKKANSIKNTSGKKASSSEHIQPPKSQKNVLKTVSANALGKMEFPPIRWVVPNILGEGYAILAGRPKRGKSWFALGLSLAVASGGYVLGKIKVEAGDVLYLALEDNLRRLQNRLQKLNDPGKPLPSRLHLITDILPLKDGGAEAIRNWLNAHPETRLVVVDTVSHPKFIPPRGKGNDIFQEDYRFGAWLQKLAHEHHLGLLGLNHTKKTEVTYAVDAVSGSTGITAPADTILVIDSATKGKASAILHITGRDVPSQELALKFENSSWSLMGTAEEFTVTDQRKQIIDLLRNYGPMNPKEIADSTKSTHGAIRKLLFEMRKANLVIQEGGARSKYTLPNK